MSINHRPQIHFSPKSHWMNDPNGLVYYKGVYHLFFQHYPEGTTWGPMHWGHAVSSDLVNWTEQPIALEPDEKGYIFSGSAVVDHKNTSGLGSEDNPPIVAIFTYHDPKLESSHPEKVESQALAYSLDHGNTWLKYSGNPVLKSPGLKDFRDPKVFWYEPNGVWIMVLSTYEKTLFYQSADLKNWTFLSDFGDGLGAHGGVWECPDLFPLKIENSDVTKWVLIQSLNPGHVNGGSGTQYFIGDFNGKEFKMDAVFENQLSKEQALWLDYGRDNYAGVSWSNVPMEDDRRLLISWMSNWQYAQNTPTTGWRNAMTLPRTLSLKLGEHGYRLCSRPVEELTSVTSPILKDAFFKHFREGVLLDRSKVNLNSCHIKLSLTHAEKGVHEFIFADNSGCHLTFGFDSDKKHFFVDRRNSGTTEFSELFANGQSLAPMPNSTSNVDLELIVDQSSLELFWNHGEITFTELFYPKEPFTRFEYRNSEQARVDITLNEVNQIRL